jgi:hypothetical protein
MANVAKAHTKRLLLMKREQETIPQRNGTGGAQELDDFMQASCKCRRMNAVTCKCRFLKKNLQRCAQDATKSSPRLGRSRAL